MVRRCKLSGPPALARCSSACGRNKHWLLRKCLGSGYTFGLGDWPSVGPVDFRSRQPGPTLFWAVEAIPPVARELESGWRGSRAHVDSASAPFCGVKHNDIVCEFAI